jgi:hypothetical protein
MPTNPARLARLHSFLLLSFRAGPCIFQRFFTFRFGRRVEVKRGSNSQTVRCITNRKKKEASSTEWLA